MGFTPKVEGPLLHVDDFGNLLVHQHINRQREDCQDDECGENPGHDLNKERYRILYQFVAKSQEFWYNSTMKKQKRILIILIALLGIGLVVLAYLYGSGSLFQGYLRGSYPSLSPSAPTQVSSPTYSDWSDSLNGSPTADPDSDNQQNLQEYTFGSDPKGTQETTASSLERLSSGSKIDSADDDESGFTTDGRFVEEGYTIQLTR